MARNISQTKRQIVFARDGWMCVYCGKESVVVFERRTRPKRLCVIPRDEYGWDYEIDHLFPVASGGDNSFDNLVTSCRNCNSAKSNKEKIKPKHWFFRVNIKQHEVV